MKTIITTTLCLLYCINVFAQEGALEERSFTHNDSLRSYLLYVPAAYDGSSEWPLVLNYHGFNIMGRFQNAIDEMNLAADTANFLIAYPNGLLVQTTVDGAIGPGWNFSGALSENDDLEFTEEVINHIKMDYMVNESRIHATGWSMGSQMTLQMACSSDRIASVAGVSGQMTNFQLADCEIDRPMSVFIIHGTADPIISFEGMNLLDGNTIQSVEETVEFWAAHNGCMSDPSTTELDDIITEDSSTVTFIEYGSCTNDTKVQLYRVNEGGHTWPGGSFPGGAWPPFLGNVNRDFNASAEILSFFSDNPRSEPQVGIVEEKSFMHGDSLRSYLLYVPASYDGSSEWPLVLNYHGFQIDAAFQMNFSQMNAAADSMGFLVAYPQGLTVSSDRLGSGLGWSTLNITSENDDISFSNSMIDHIAINYKVDMDHIHATGWSNGSFMAYYMACSLSDRIASVAGVSGQMPALMLDACDPGRPLSVMQFHGTRDPIVPYEGISDEIPPVPTTPSFWVNNNNCSPDSVVTELENVSTADSSTVIRTEYSNCEDETEVVLYTINNGGHPWPGSTPIPGLEFLGHTNQDINATTEILAFFSRNPKMPLGTSTEELHNPSEISLSVYPNPFVERFTIEFDLEDSSQIESTLFNVLGQEVRPVVNSSLSPGRHRIEWSSVDVNVPPGLYFLRLKIGNELITKPVMRVAR